jgi:predicted thioesterase
MGHVRRNDVTVRHTYAIPIGFELEGNLTFSIDSHERRTYDLLETASQDSVLSHIYHLDVWLPPR